MRRKKMAKLIRTNPPTRTKRQLESAVRRRVSLAYRAFARYENRTNHDAALALVIEELAKAKRLEFEARMFLRPVAASLASKRRIDGLFTDRPSKAKSAKKK